MANNYARKKALLAVLGFAAAATAFAPLYLGSLEDALLVAFYVALLINTFFSIRCFSSMTEGKDAAQKFYDIILGILYIALPLQFGNTLRFTAITMVLFAVATRKYVSLLKQGGHRKLLERKISVDTLGVLLAGVSMWIAAEGNPFAGAFTLAAVFIAANIYYLFINPLYRIPGAE